MIRLAIGADLKPVDAVRVPGSGELVYSERPHLESERKRLKDGLASYRYGLLSPQTLIESCGL